MKKRKKRNDEHVHTKRLDAGLRERREEKIIIEPADDDDVVDVIAER